MDDLTKLEANLEKLSGLFFNSINLLQRYAPLVRKEGEEDMENSAENVERIRVENIENYQENKENYTKLIADCTKDVNSTFEEINTVVEHLKEDINYGKTEEELIQEIKALRENNEAKVKTLNEKVKLAEDIVDHIKNENEMNMHLFRYKYYN